MAIWGSMALLISPASVAFSSVNAIFHNRNARAVLTTPSQPINSSEPGESCGQGSISTPAVSSTNAPAPMLITVVSATGYRSDRRMARPMIMLEELASKQTRPNTTPGPGASSSRPGPN